MLRPVAAAHHAAARRGDAFDPCYRGLACRVGVRASRGSYRWNLGLVLVQAARLLPGAYSDGLGA